MNEHEQARMSKLEQAKFFNDLSRDCISSSSELQQSVRDLFVKLQDINTLTNTFPHVIYHRKLNIQRLINATLSNIDSIANELKNASFESKNYEATAKRYAELEKSKVERQAIKEKNYEN